MLGVVIIQVQPLYLKYWLETVLLGSEIGAIIYIGKILKTWRCKYGWEGKEKLLEILGCSGCFSIYAAEGSTKVAFVFAIKVVSKEKGEMVIILSDWVPLEYVWDYTKVQFFRTICLKAIGVGCMESDQKRIGLFSWWALQWTWWCCMWSRAGVKTG